MSYNEIAVVLNLMIQFCRGLAIDVMLSQIEVILVLIVVLSL